VRIAQTILSALLPLLLAACMAPVVIGGIAVYPSMVSPAIETAHEVHDSSEQEELKVKAASGDHEAEYALGESYCCHVGGPLDHVSVYDNEKATYWYCRAAREGYGPAQLRLAAIYSGHPIHGFRSVQYASAWFGDPGKNMQAALMWANVAAGSGETNATALRERIRDAATPEQRREAEELGAHWHTAPCVWSEVMPAAKTDAKSP
jgi:hypothetical protein